MWGRTALTAFALKLKEKERRQTWDDRSAHITVKTLRQAYKAAKWLSYIQSIVKRCMADAQLCLHCNVVIPQFGLQQSYYTSAIKVTFHFLIEHYLLLRSLWSSVQATGTGCNSKLFDTDIITTEILGKAKPWFIADKRILSSVQCAFVIVTQFIQFTLIINYRCMLICSAIVALIIWIRKHLQAKLGKT